MTTRFSREGCQKTTSVHKGEGDQKTLFFLTKWFMDGPSVSWLVTLYIQYVYVFQHDQFGNVNESSMRWKSLCWKIFLTILSCLLNIFAPLEATPLVYQLLSKGGPYNR